MIRRIRLNSKACDAQALQLDDEVASLDLAPVKWSLAVRHGWSRKKILQAERETREFLQWIRNDAAGHRWVPTSLLVDEFLHEYSTACSELFLSDCVRLYGSVLQHYGFAGLFGEADAQQQEMRHRESLASIEAMRAAQRQMSSSKPST